MLKTIMATTELLNHYTMDVVEFLKRIITIIMEMLKLIIMVIAEVLMKLNIMVTIELLVKLKIMLTMEVLVRLNILVTIEIIVKRIIMDTTTKLFPYLVPHRNNLWKSEEEKKEEEEEKKEISLAERFGYEEIFSVKVWRSSFAELLGTATLTFMTDAITISSSKVETEARILIPSTTIPIIVTFLVLATIPVTGGHINPIVSMSFGLMGRIPLCRAVIYILAQCIGGILGALALKSVADSETERTSSLGGCTVAKVTMGPDGPFTSGLDTSRAFYLEVICSFVFLFISRWIAFDAKKADMVSRVIYCFGIGIGVGFNAFVSRTVTGASGYSGVGVNPATCFGPAIVRGGQLWDRHWIFWIGPIIASIGFYSYTRIIVVDDARIKENKHDFLNILKACYKAI